jgi:hypothetical protein
MTIIVIIWEYMDGFNKQSKKIMDVSAIQHHHTLRLFYNLRLATTGSIRPFSISTHFTSLIKRKLINVLLGHSARGGDKAYGIYTRANQTP